MVPELLQEASTKVAAIVVQTEQNAPRGWSYTVQVNHLDGTQTNHVVTMAWADHEHWCGGRVAPSVVVEAVVAYVLDHRADDSSATLLPASFDTARARRWFPQIDEALRDSL